jgi:hypothetical protein
VGVVVVWCGVVVVVVVVVTRRFVRAWVVRGGVLDACGRRALRVSVVVSNRSEFGPSQLGSAVINSNKGDWRSDRL